MFRFDHNDIDPVVRSVERRIQREALRQLDSVDLDDDDSRVDSLAPLEGADVADTTRADEATVGDGLSGAGPAAD